MTKKPLPPVKLVSVTDQTDLSVANLLLKIRADMPRMTRANRSIADYLLSSPEEFMQTSIGQIAEKAEVSEPSVIRFCRNYDFKGIAEFRIALAMALAQGEEADTARIEPVVSDKARMNRQEKEAIAIAAFQNLGTAQSILLDGGSTMEIFAHQLRRASPLKIMTTGLNVAEVLHGTSQHQLMLPGGVLRPESRSLVGDLVETSLAQLRFDIVFLGADAIDPDFGLSTYNEAEARQNARMIEVGSRVVVLADSTKFGAPRLHRCCGLERVHMIITDTGLPNDIYEEVTARGTQVVRAALS